MRTIKKMVNHGINGLQRKRFTALLMLFIIIILCAKVWLIMQPRNEAVVLGELSNEKFAPVCRVSVNELVHVKSQSMLRTEEENICENYRDKHDLRGFYIHHYASLLEKIPGKGESVWDVITERMKHQYGISGTILASILTLTNTQVTANAYSAISLGSFLVTPLVLFLSNRVKILRTEELNIALFLTAIILASINIDQYILSPGFIPLRFLPVTLISLVFLYTERVGFDEDQVKEEKLILSVSGLVLLITLFMSIQFALMTLVVTATSIALGYILMDQVSKDSRINGNWVRRQKRLACILLSIATGFLLLGLNVLQSGKINIIFNSSSDVEPNWLSIIKYAIVYLVFWLTAKSSEKNSIPQKGKFCVAETISSPLATLPIIFYTYPGYFYGSPNHMSLFLLSVLIPYSVIGADFIKLITLTMSEITIKRVSCDNNANFSDGLLKDKFKQGKNPRENLDCYLIAIRNQQVIPRCIGASIMLIGLLVPVARLLNQNFGLTPNQLIKVKTQSYSQKVCNQKIDIYPIMFKACTSPMTKHEISKILIFVKNGFPIHINKTSKADIILSDWASVVSSRYFSGTEEGLTGGKMMIYKDIRIRRLYEASFSRFQKGRKAIMHSGNYKEKRLRLLIYSEIDVLKNGINNIKGVSHYAKSLRTKVIGFDINSTDELESLYVSAFLKYDHNGVVDNSPSLLEIISKLHKYLWREIVKDQLYRT